MDGSLDDISWPGWPRSGRTTIGELPVTAPGKLDVGDEQKVDGVPGIVRLNDNNGAAALAHGDLFRMFHSDRSTVGEMDGERCKGLSFQGGAKLLGRHGNTSECGRAAAMRGHSAADGATTLQCTPVPVVVKLWKATRASTTPQRYEDPAGGFSGRNFSQTFRSSCPKPLLEFEVISWQ